LSCAARLLAQELFLYTLSNISPTLSGILTLVRVLSFIARFITTANIEYLKHAGSEMLSELIPAVL